jgi:hypothetical protein
MFLSLTLMFLVWERADFSAGTKKEFHFGAECRYCFARSAHAPWFGNLFGIPQNSAINPIPDLLNSRIFIGILFFRS